MFPWLWYIRKNPESPEQLAEICKTPAKVALWMWHRIWYKSDHNKHGVRQKFDRPKKVLKDKSGDCEEFAGLAFVTLPYLDDVGECHFIGVFEEGTGKGHAVCAYQYKGKWFHMSNWGNVKCPKAKSLEDIPGYVYKKWKTWTEYFITKGRMKPVKRHFKGVEL